MTKVVVGFVLGLLAVAGADVFAEAILLTMYHLSDLTLYENIDVI